MSQDSLWHQLLLRQDLIGGLVSSHEFNAFDGTWILYFGRLDRWYYDPIYPNLLCFDVVNLHYQLADGQIQEDPRGAIQFAASQPHAHISRQPNDIFIITHPYGEAITIVPFGSPAFTEHPAS